MDTLLVFFQTIKYCWTYTLFLVLCIADLTSFDMIRKRVYMWNLDDSNIDYVKIVIVGGERSNRDRTLVETFGCK